MSAKFILIPGQDTIAVMPNKKNTNSCSKKQVILLFFIDEIKAYKPTGEQEAADKASILAMIDTFPENILLRENTIAHMTSSGFVVNKTMDKVLFIHHNIYKSWGWTGGHADGETDLLETACREVREETGLKTLSLLLDGIAALDILPVLPHRKNGRYIGTHLHFSPAYLLQGDEQEPLHSKPDENSGVRWFSLEEIPAVCTETHMLPVYKKLIRRLQTLQPPG